MPADDDGLYLLFLVVFVINLVLENLMKHFDRQASRPDFDTNFIKKRKAQPRNPMKIGDLVRLDSELLGLEPHEPNHNILGMIVGFVDKFPNEDEVQVLWNDGFLNWHLGHTLVWVEP